MKTRACALSSEAAAFGVPLGWFVALNHRAFDFFFMRDDPCLLASAMENGITAHLTDPVVWRSLSSSLLMPWQIVSLGLDLRLFGLEPRGFYAHHLLSFGLLLLAGYVTLRRFLAPAWASLALVLFVTAPPAVAVAELLMNRHYIEGLAFALMAVLLQLVAIRRQSWKLWLGSAAFYALSASAKEVFVPLVAVLPFLPEGSAKQRLRSAAPHGLVAFGYVLFRLHMLGWNNLLETYGSNAPGGSSPVSAYGAAAALVVTAATIGVLRRSRRRLAVLLASCVAIVLPLTFVTSGLEPRHYFLPAFAASGITALALGELRRPLLARGLAVAAVMLSVAALAASPQWRRLAESERHYRAEGAFLSDHRGKALLLTNLENTLYLSCTERLRAASGEPSTVAFCGEPCLCESWFDEAPRYRYINGTIVPAEHAENTCRLGEAPDVTFLYDAAASRVSWELGPHANGSYEILLLSGAAPGSISVPRALPRQGSAPLYLSTPLRVIVKYRSPEGWLAFSPVQALAP